MPNLQASAESASRRSPPCMHWPRNPSLGKVLALPNRCGWERRLDKLAYASQPYISGSSRAFCIRYATRAATIASYLRASRCATFLDRAWNRRLCGPRPADAATLRCPGPANRSRKRRTGLYARSAACRFDLFIVIKHAARGTIFREALALT
jgi:hypothetical protein